MKIHPAPNRILVEQFKQEEKEGSIIIPESYRKLINKGRIARLGKDTEEKPQLYKEGQIVYFPSTANMIPHVEDDKAYVIINQYDVYATED